MYIELIYLYIISYSLNCHIHIFKLCLLRAAQTVNIDLCCYNRKCTQSTLIVLKMFYNGKLSAI